MPRLLRLAGSSTVAHYRVRPGALVASAGAVAVLLAVATRLRRLEVVGTSMRPTLEPGDRVVAVRGRRRVRAGDLVIVPDPRLRARLVVKRVAAVSEETVTVRGDNEAASTDSRTFGPVPRVGVQGRVVYRYHPPVRRGRIGRRRPGRPVP